MKIEVGYYRTRGGRKARVLCTDAPGTYALIGYVEGEMQSGDSLQDGYSSDCCPVTYWWLKSGAYTKGHVSDDDLVAPWSERSKTLKLYPALRACGDDIFLVTDQLFASEADATRQMDGFVRLLTEFPVVEVEVPA